MIFLKLKELKMLLRNKRRQNWVDFQWFVGRVLFRLGLINRIVWDNRWPNKVFFYK